MTIGENAERIWNELFKPQSIPLDNPAVLQMIGPCSVRFAENAVECTPYEQLVLRCSQVYYSTLPYIGYSYRALAVIHICTRVHLGRIDKISDEALHVAYKDLDDRGFVPIISKLGELIFSEEELNMAKLGEVATLNRLNTIIEAFPVNDHDLLSLYNMIGHYVEGGVECINPVPIVIVGNAVLRGYVNALGTGGYSKSIIEPVYAARDKTLPSSSFQEKQIGDVSKATELIPLSEKAKLLGTDKQTEKGGTSCTKDTIRNLSVAVADHDRGNKKRRLDEGSGIQKTSLETSDAVVVLKSIHSAITNLSDKTDQMYANNLLLADYVKKLAESVTTFVNQSLCGKDLVQELGDSYKNYSLPCIMEMCKKPSTIGVQGRRELIKRFKDELVKVNQPGRAGYVTEAIFENPSELDRLFKTLNGEMYGNNILNGDEDNILNGEIYGGNDYYTPCSPSYSPASPKYNPR